MEGTQQMGRAWFLERHASITLVWLAWVSVGGCKGAGHTAGTNQPETGTGRGTQGTAAISDSSVQGVTHPGGTSADAGTDTEAVIASPCLSPGSVVAANATGKLLVALQHLMDENGPPGRLWPSIAWSWDTQWQSRPRGHAAIYGCWTGSWIDSRGRRRPPGWSNDILNQEFCTHGGFGDAEWRLRVPEAVNYYVGGRPIEPELTRRIQASGSLHPEQDQSCVALSAVLDHGSGLVTCLGGQGLSSFQIRVPQEAVSPGGVLANLGVGTLIRLHGQQILRKTAGHWLWDEIPLAGITVAEVPRAGCSLPPPPATVYPVVAQVGQEVTFPLVWSSGENTFRGPRRYIAHEARRTITPITVSVIGTELSETGTNLIVRWTVLTTERGVRFVCSDRRLFAGQGIMLQLPDGNRLVPTRAGGPLPRPNQPTDSSCVFQLPQPVPQGPMPVGYKLIYVPADNLPGWWQDDFGGLPRPRAVLEVDLAGSPRREEPAPQLAAPAASGDAGGPGAVAGAPGVDAGAAASSGAATETAGRPRHHHRTRPRNPRPGPDLGDLRL
jgi:hypothetical protein